MIIMQVTNKVLIGFFLPKEIMLDTNTFTISTSFKNIRPIMVIKFIFSLLILQNIKFYFPISISDNKFLCFIMLGFFGEINILQWLHFC